MLQEVMQVAVKGLLYSSFSLQSRRVHTEDSGKLVVLDRHGIGNCNDNGRLLLEFCSEHQLVITDTLFQQKGRVKVT